MKKRNLIFVFIFLFICGASSIFAQKVEQIEKAEGDITKEKTLRQKLEREKKKSQIEEKALPERVPSQPEKKIFVKEIAVTGITFLAAEEVNKIISPYQNKELTLREIQKVADLITDAYRQKGYVTSRAYIPPQKIEAGRVEISLVEGITGDIDIKGNRYFKTILLKKRIPLKRGEPFDYHKLRAGLSKINELPDRNIKAVLAPGKDPATTDLALEVKDRLPIHIGFNWDNFGADYIDRNRFRETITHNNFLGHDDIFTLQYQVSEAERCRLLTLRYLYPLNDNLQLGFSATETKIKLGRDYEDTTVRGKSRFYSISAIQNLINKENLDLDLNLGFDYKDTFNFQSGLETSRDRMRIAKAELDLDLSDTLGRTIMTNEIAFGLPGIMGGLHHKDSKASRAGSGGRFIKNTLNILRLQKMPFNSLLLWKNQLQFSPYTLTSTEQFQVGGIVNVRGYPAAEVVGDRGYAMTWEWSLPPYFIPKRIKVPLSGSKLYDTLKLIAFYDWANARLRRPLATEEKNKTLRAAGWGLRFNLPQNFSVRLEFAWPLDNKPSDGDHLHTWTEVSLVF